MYCNEKGIKKDPEVLHGLVFLTDRAAVGPVAATLISDKCHDSQRQGKVKKSHPEHCLTILPLKADRQENPYRLGYTFNVGSDIAELELKRTVARKKYLP